MSSNYNLLCLNHDPALVIDSDYNTPLLAEDAYRLLKAGELRVGTGYDSLLVHRNCHLMVGRYSYPLVELGCLEGVKHGHVGIRWIDRDVLRLLLYIEWSDDNEYMTRPFVQCFRYELIHRLRHEINPEE